MAKLRSPEGCPWDRQQTHESLKPYLLEETYEVLDAIDKREPEALKEELGDVLLQILFHAQIASERSDFTFEHISQSLAQKLVRRHPHVFNKSEEPSSQNLTAQQVLHQWETIKRQERPSTETDDTLFESVPRTAPALLRAYQIQRRASRHGFDWTHHAPVQEKLKEECDELCLAVSQAFETSSSSHSRDSLTDHASDMTEAIEEEVGDLFFSLVNVARFLRVNPEEALRKSTDKFIRRVSYVQSCALANGLEMEHASASQLDAWWEDAKCHDQE